MYGLSLQRLHFYAKPLSEMLEWVNLDYGASHTLTAISG